MYNEIMHLQSILHLLIAHRYAMLLILSLIEGPLVCLCAGIMIHFGYFSPFPAFLIIIVGDVVPNSISYTLGKISNHGKLTRNLLEKLNITEKHFEMLEKLWVKNTNKTMFLAKLAWGLGVPLFMSAGMTTLSFKKFLGSMTLVAALQYSVVLTLGYYLAHSYQLIITSNNYIEFGGLTFSVIIFGAILLSASRFARTTLLTE